MEKADDSFDELYSLTCAFVSDSNQALAGCCRREDTRALFLGLKPPSKTQLKEGLQQMPDVERRRHKMWMILGHGEVLRRFGAACVETLGWNGID